MKHHIHHPRSSTPPQTPSVMAAEPLVVLPGDTIDPSLIPTHKKNPLRLGPGLRHVPPSQILPTVAGQMVTDHRKNSMWVEYNGGHVSPIPPSVHPQQTQLTFSPPSVHPRAIRPHHRPSRPLRLRLLPRLHCALQPQRNPPAPRLRGRDQKDPTPTRQRRAGLCARVARQQAHGSRARMRVDINGQSRRAWSVDGGHGV